MADVTAVNRDGYRWIAQLCPVCGVPPANRLGRRGGAAHRGHLGVECEIWRCGRCELVFPNPMPIPLGGPGQHYRQSADDYFEHHGADAKRQSALALVQRARELTGRRGRLLDIGAGRGEVLLAARQDGWAVVGIEPSTNFAEHVPALNGPFAFLEPLAARAVVALGRYGGLGSQIETWALKQRPGEAR